MTYLGFGTEDTVDKYTPTVKDRKSRYSQMRNTLKAGTITTNGL